MKPHSPGVLCEFYHSLAVARIHCHPAADQVSLVLGTALLGMHSPSEINTNPGNKNIMNMGEYKYMYMYTVWRGEDNKT